MPPQTLSHREWPRVSACHDTVREFSDIRDPFDIGDYCTGGLSASQHETPVAMITFSPGRAFPLNPADTCRQQDIRKVPAGVVHQ
jgi:hypothetical protein